jgi:hypothetical protein
MASESPLETLAAVTDHVIDIMKYAFEDSYSEIPASPVARSHVDYSDVIDYVEDEVNDVPVLIDENGNVIGGKLKESGKLTVIGGVGIEECCARIGCLCSRCSPKKPELVIDGGVFRAQTQQPQLVVDGNMTVKGEVVFCQRNAELTRVQTSVDAVMSKITELSAVLDHVEQMAVSDTRMNGLAEGISSACNAFTSAFQTTEQSSVLPDLEQGIQRVEDILHVVKDEVCTTQSQMDGLEYLLDKSTAEITDNLVSCETELSNQMTDISKKLSIAKHDIREDLTDLAGLVRDKMASGENEIRGDVSELGRVMLDQLSYTLRELEDTIELRASDIHSDIDAGSKHIEDIIDGAAAVLKEDIAVRCNDIHSDIDIIHRRLEEDLSKVPDSVRDLLREDITNLKVAVQTCVNGLRQESKLDRAERDALAKDLDTLTKRVDDLSGDIERFHYEWLNYSRKIVEPNFETYSSVLKELHAKVADIMDYSESRFESNGAILRSLQKQSDKQHVQMAELTNEFRDLSSYATSRFEPQMTMLEALQKKSDEQQRQIDSLTSMVRLLLERVPEPQRKPNEPDWDAL